MTDTRPGRAQRTGFGLLCALPFLAGALAVRSLRISGVHQAIGVVVFATVCLAGWTIGGRVIKAGSEAGRVQALAGGLLLVPFALIGLLWVGLGTPWDATPPENLMRYLVLLAGAVAVTGGFVVLTEASHLGGERLYSTLGLGAGIMSGAAYLVWLAFQVGAWSARVRTAEAIAPAAWLNNALDTLLFIACVLGYVATGAFAASFGKNGWLGRCATLGFVLASLAACVLVVIRGLSFPDPTAGSTPWYTRPGFIAGIPAVPWIMPHLLGAVMLRRAGEQP